MMGLAASPGTDVEPICSIPRALRMRVASCPKASGQKGSLYDEGDRAIDGSGLPHGDLPSRCRTRLLLPSRAW